MRGLFFNAQPTTDIVAHPSGYDREYDSDDFNRYMGVFFSNGIFVRNDPDACKVVASGLRLDATPGVVLLDGGQCHFEAGDGVTIAQGDGLYSVMCRRNNAAAVRAFELVAIKGVEAYPAPVREGDIYDLCLAHVQVAGGAATVTDTREDRELCGFAALTGQPPYYPPDEANLPYILWLYVLGLPMTEEQVAAVEGNPSLMEIYRAKSFFNKEEALGPATKEMYGLGADAVPDEALRALPGRIDHIGTIKYSARAGLGSAWVLCNGAGVSISDSSPEFVSLLPPRSNYAQVWKNGDVGDRSRIGYAQTGYTLCFDDNGTKILLRWAKATPRNLTATTQWYSYEIPESLSGSQPFGGFIYGNGYYMAYGSGAGASKNQPWVCYTTSLESGVWTYRVLDFVGSALAGSNINGKFVLAGGAGSTNIMWADTPDVVWTKETVNATETTPFNFLPVYLNGQYVICGVGSLYYSSALNGPWTKVTVTSSDIWAIAYSAGKYVCSGSNSIFVATSLAGPWTAHAKFTSGSNASDIKALDDGRYLVTITYSSTVEVWISNTTDPAGAWTKYAVSGVPNQYSVRIADVYKVGDIIQLVCAGGPYGVYQISNAQLPSISPDKAYAYIKIKEMPL